MTSAVARDQEKNMDFWYSSEKWKDVLEAEETATICVPPCLDVLKTWKRNDLDEAPYLAPNISGQKGEAAFMLKFQELKLGGILVSGLESCDLVASRTVPKKIIQKGEWDAIFFHQRRGIFVIEVKATEVNDENTVNKRMEKVKIQLERNIKNIKQSFLSLYQKECTCINGFICFPFRNEDRDNYEGYKVIDMSALNDRSIFRKFFEPQTNETRLEVSLLKSFVAEFVCCRSKVEFHSQAYNAIKVATWIMEQDIAQKQDSTKLANISSNGPSGKIILTAQQLEIVECREKCITIYGAPGSGKTLILMLRALRAAMENKAGSVFVFVNEKLKAKYEHFFYEERDNIIFDKVSNTDRRPKVQTIDKIDFAKPEDDVFFDETPVEDSYIEKVESRANCSGSTTVVFTGLYTPGEAVPAFRLYQPRLREFKHFELMKVLRGTGNIFGEWEHYYPHGITIGHNIYGVTVKNETFDNFEQVQNEIANKIDTLTNSNMSTFDLLALKNHHIAVITCDDHDSTKMRNYFDTKEIPCGQVNEQARKLKSTSIVAVDVYLNTPSYEWPIVFIVLKPGVTKEEVMPIAASRCIASLSIFTYKNFQATTASSKTDELEPTEEKIFIESNQSSLIFPSSSSQSNTEDRQQILETQFGSRILTAVPIENNRRAPPFKRFICSRKTMCGIGLLLASLFFILPLTFYFVRNSHMAISSNTEQDVHNETRKLTNYTRSNIGDLQKYLDTVQKSLKVMYSQRFKIVKPFSLPFMFDNENMWVSLALREYSKYSKPTMDYSELLNTALEKEKMLIMEGNPATGKTTLMRRMAYEWANGTQELSHFDLIIYAEFREVREQKFENITDLILQYNKKYDRFIDSAQLESLKLLLSNKTFCKERRILLLLDGYDESSLDKQCTELSSYFSSTTTDMPLSFYVVITTRPGYLSKHRGNRGRFVFADVLGFTSPEQKEKYINNHFLSAVESGQEEKEAVHRLLQRNENLNKIAETPLFLTFICLVHEKIIDGTLVELYSKIIWWLIDRHQQDFRDRDLPALFGYKNVTHITYIDNLTNIQDNDSPSRSDSKSSFEDKVKTIQDNYLQFPQIYYLGKMAMHNLDKNIFEETDNAQFNLQPIIEQVGLLRREEKYDKSFKLFTAFVFPHRTIQEFLAAFYCLCSNDPASEWLLPDSKLYTYRMNEFERFILRIALSDKMPVHLEKRKYYFENITDMKLDIKYDSFYTATSFNYKLLNWFLSQCTNVKTIELTGTYGPVESVGDGVTDTSLRNGPAVTSDISSLTMFTFSDLIKLHSLIFWGWTFSANSQLSFTNCPLLKNLEFSHCDMQRSTIVGIETLPAIHTLRFDKCTIDLATWQSITDQIKKSNVKFLQLLFDGYFNKEFLIHLQKCNNVERMEIEIGRYDIHHNDLLPFTDLIKLSSLEFSGCTLSANSQLSFTNCPSLKNLIFYNCFIKSGIILGITTLPAIDTVQFYRWNIDLAIWQSITDQISNSNVTSLHFSADFFVEYNYPEFLHHLLKCERIQQIHVKDVRDHSCDYLKDRDILNHDNDAEDRYSFKFSNNYILNCNEESVTENLALTAQKLPALTSIIISDEYGRRLDESRRLNETNKERIEKAGQERNPKFLIQYVEKSLL